MEGGTNLNTALQTASITGEHANGSYTGGEGDSSDGFKYSVGLSTDEARVLLMNHGKNEMPEKKVPQMVHLPDHNQ